MYLQVISQSSASFILVTNHSATTRTENMKNRLNLQVTGEKYFEMFEKNI